MDPDQLDKIKEKVAETEETVQVQDETSEPEIAASQDAPRNDTPDSTENQDPSEEVAEVTETTVQDGTVPTKDTSESQPVTDDETPESPITTGAAALEERGTGKKALRGHIVITKTDDPEAHWYVVHTTSGHEARIAESLRQRIETMSLEAFVFELLIPTQDRVIIRGGKKYTVKEKIFPGYLLVKMILTDEAWLAVRTTQGITGFVGAGTKPSPLSESEVNNIQKFVAAPAARYKVRFSTGEAVKITDGPFSQFLGTISEMDEARGKVKVLVSIFGRETPVELDFLQIAKV